MDLSIIIPTFNRSDSLKKTLQSIVEQENGDINFEVIVVDNGSTDDTAVVCRHASAQILNFIYHYDSEPGQLTGRHRGTAISKADILSFIDDDVELNTGWVKSVVELFRNRQDVSIIGGPCLPKYHMYPPFWVKHFFQPTPYGGSMCLPLSLIDLDLNEELIDPVYVFGLNYSIRKRVLLELDGFHPDCIPTHLQKFQGDGETGLSLKCRRKGFKALYSELVFLYHQVVPERLSVRHFENWYYYNGVCQSFTDIREAQGTQKMMPAAVTGRTLVRGILSSTATRAKRMVSKNKPGLPDQVIQLKSSFHNHYEQGYNFHQRCYQSESIVREWVLRPNYWDYKLPV